MTEREELALCALEVALAECRTVFGGLAYATVSDLTLEAYETAPEQYRPIPATEVYKPTGMPHIQRRGEYVVLFCRDEDGYRIAHPEYRVAP